MWVTLSKEKLAKQEDSLYKGRYVLVVNADLVSGIDKNALVTTFNKHAPLNKNWNGKTYLLERAWIEGNNIAIQIDIIQNPIPLIAILGGLGFLLGGVLLWQILVEVRKSLTLFGDVGKILLYAGGVLLVLWLWSKYKKK